MKEGKEVILDLKLAATGREYLAVPRERLLHWIAEGRVLPDDLVRPAGARRWMKVSLAPELGGASAGAVQPKAAPPPARPEDRDLGIPVPARNRPRRPRRRLEDSFLEMTPMIDVTFQLLIFFMFTNQLANPTAITVPEAAYGRGVTPDGKQIILIDDQARYYLGESTREENVAASLDALVQEVADNARGQDESLEVIISAHKSARHVEVRELVERLGDVDNVGTIRLGVEERR